MIKISIIIPIYNMEKYLEECLDSVISQTLKDVEMICINDGSTDRTLDILTSYQEKYNNIRVINQQNCGVAAARNKGLEVAGGEFVAFLDPDDFYTADNILELLYNTANENGVAVCGGSMCFYSEGKTSYQPPDSRKKSIFIRNELIEYNKYQYAYGFQRFIYKREILCNNSINFPPYIRFQDPPFMVRALLAAKKLFVISEVVYCLRIVDKKIDYSNEEVMRGIAKGMQDLLYMALDNNLVELYKHTIDEIFSKYAMRLYSHVLRGSKSVENEIVKINKLLDNNIVRENEEVLKGTKLRNKNEIFELAEEERKELMEFDRQLYGREYIIIYGAGAIGKETYDYINERLAETGYRPKIKFAVTDLKDDTSTARGGVIYRIRDLAYLKDHAVVVLATQEKFWIEITKNLEQIGFRNIIKSDIEAIRLLKK